MTMDSGLYRIEVTGLAGLARLRGSPACRIPGLGGDFSDRPGTAPAKTFTPRFVGMLAVLMAGLGAWMLLSGHGSNTAEGEPVRLATAAIAEPVPSPIPENAEERSLPNPAAAPAEAAPLKLRPSTGSRFRRSPGEGAAWGRKPWSR